MNIFKHSKKLNQSGFDHILVVVSCMVVIAVVGTYVLISNSHAAATSQAELKSGISGTYCLDDNADGGTNAIVDTWGCNGTPAQKFSYSGNLLHIGTNGCAREAGSSATTGQGKGAKWAGSVVIGSCSGPPYGAVWERVGSTFENAHAGSKGGTYCLDVSAFKAKTQLDIYQCNGGANQSWTNYTWTSGGGSGGGGGGGTTACPNGNKATPSVAKQIAQCLMPSFGFSVSTQYASCLVPLWQGESGWVYNAENASGAYGIPQSLPGSKMASEGSDWPTDATTQIKWGLSYIKAIYGSPCNAWAFKQGHGYYIVKS